MTLTQYQNQKIIRRNPYHCVTLKAHEYDAIQLTTDLVKIVIHAYPAFDYYLDNKSGKVVTLEGAPTVFHVYMDRVEILCPNFKPTKN